MSIAHSRQSEAIWEEVKRMTEFRRADLVRFGCSEQKAGDYIRRWLADHRIRISRMERTTKVYAPVDGTTVAAPNTGSPEGNMWFVMRRLNAFTPLDLAAHANTDDVTVTLQAARDYCRLLMTAGYLRVLERAKPGVREAVYKLINETGPKPPRSSRMRGVLDPNEGRFIPSDPGVRT